MTSLYNDIVKNGLTYVYLMLIYMYLIFPISYWDTTHRTVDRERWVGRKERRDKRKEWRVGESWKVPLVRPSHMSNITLVPCASYSTCSDEFCTLTNYNVIPLKVFDQHRLVAFHFTVYAHNKRKYIRHFKLILGVKSQIFGFRLVMNFRRWFYDALSDNFIFPWL